MKRLLLPRLHPFARLLAASPLVLHHKGPVSPLPGPAYATLEQRSSSCLGLIPVGLVSCPAGIRQQSGDLFSSVFSPVKWGTSNDASFETLHRVFESSSIPIVLFFFSRNNRWGLPWLNLSKGLRRSMWHCDKERLRVKLAVFLWKSLTFPEMSFIFVCALYFDFLKEKENTPLVVLNNTRGLDGMPARVHHPCLGGVWMLFPIPPDTLWNGPRILLGEAQAQITGALYSTSPASAPCGLSQPWGSDPCMPSEGSQLLWESRLGG